MLLLRQWLLIHCPSAFSKIAKTYAYLNYYLGLLFGFRKLKLQDIRLDKIYCHWEMVPHVSAA